MHIGKTSKVLGDKTIAKKILFCYYPEKVLPIFKTEDLEHFAKNFRIGFQKEAYDSYGKSYEMLSVGQKFEILNKVLVEFKNTIPEFKGWDNVLFARFLYDCFPPQRPPIPPKEIKLRFKFASQTSFIRKSLSAMREQEIIKVIP